MERLTHETFSCMADFCTETECELYAECPALERYNRLKAYEDTGLSPEEVQALKEGCEDCEIARRDWELSHEFPDLDHLRELVKAEKEGRLLALPCKMGGTLYMIVTKRARVYTPEFSFIKTTYLTELNAFQVIRRFGKTVFLDRKEAEKALAELRVGNV